jgi:transposase-like protein
MAQEGKLSWEVVQCLVSHNRKDRPPFRETNVSTEKRGAPLADNLYGVVVEKEIKCPNCHDSSIKKKSHEERLEQISYECHSCGKEFDEDDLINIEMDKH